MNWRVTGSSNIGRVTPAMSNRYCHSGARWSIYRCSCTTTSPLHSVHMPTIHARDSGSEVIREEFVRPALRAYKHMMTGITDKDRDIVSRHALPSYIPVTITELTTMLDIICIRAPLSIGLCQITSGKQN